MSNFWPSSKRLVIATVLLNAMVWSGVAHCGGATPSAVPPPSGGATLVVGVAPSTGAAPSTGGQCVTKESRCGKDWAFCPDDPFFSGLAGDGCSSIAPHCPKPVYCQPDPKKSCGEYWTEWRSLGEATNDPCPAGCVATERVGHDSRNVNVFFQMQYRERWACAGTLVSKGKRALK